MTDPQLELPVFASAGAELFSSPPEINVPEPPAVQAPPPPKTHAKVPARRKTLLRVTCWCKPETQKTCEYCLGKGYLEVDLLLPPAHAVTPCCRKPWRSSVDPHAWSCPECKKVYDRHAVVGW
jgi:hypothetical protein